MGVDIPPLFERTCPHCGAELESADKRCWLCRRDPRQAKATPSIASPPGLPPESLRNYSLSSLLLFVTLAAVVLGVFTIAPGLGVPFGVVAFVVWVRTAAAVKHHRSLGKTVTLSEKVQMFLASFGFAAVMLLLVAVAGFAAFCTACFVVVSTSGVAHVKEVLPWMVASGVITVFAVLAIVKLNSYFRSRQHRELND